MKLVAHNIPMWRDMFDGKLLLIILCSVVVVKEIITITDGAIRL